MAILRSAPICMQVQHVANFEYAVRDIKKDAENYLTDFLAR